MARPNIQNAIKKSGAKMLRLVMAPGNETVYEEIFRRATSRGITILPYIGSGTWPTSQSGQEGWISYARQAVEKYGPGGSFWATVTTAKHPPHTWELWNEPNLGRHYADKVVHAAGFGDFLTAMSTAATDETARGQHRRPACRAVRLRLSDCKNNVCGKSIPTSSKKWVANCTTPGVHL